MDGRVLTEMFAAPQAVTYDDGQETAESVPVDQALNAADSAEVEDRLRSLGYL
jgi:hypothetical protein